MIASVVLAALVAGTVTGRHLLVIAHPDDETISASAFMASGAEIHVLQLTTGVPPNELTPEKLVTREAERRAAYVAAGWPASWTTLGLTGRSAIDNLAAVRDAVAQHAQGAEAIWTHPYEGGHLDHDSAAWAVQHAAGTLPRLEFASYHWTPAGDRFGVFYPSNTTTVKIALSPSIWAQKRAALAAYQSQGNILRKFKTPQDEWYRVAPIYDFSHAPPAPSRWDSRGYQPPLSTWRAAVAKVPR